MRTTKLLSRLALLLLLLPACTLYTIKAGVVTVEPALGSNTVATQNTVTTGVVTVVVTVKPDPATICTGYDQGHVNVRACGSTRCRVLTTLPEGAAVEVLTERNGWIRIADGWIYGKFICR